MNNTPSNIFQILFLLEKYYQNSQPVFGAPGMNGLKYSCMKCPLKSVVWMYIPLKMVGMK